MFRVKGGTITTMEQDTLGLIEVFKVRDPTLLETIRIMQLDTSLRVEVNTIRVDIILLVLQLGEIHQAQGLKKIPLTLEPSSSKVFSFI